MTRAKSIVAVTLFAAAPCMAAGARNEVGVVLGYVVPAADATIAGVKTETRSAFDYGLTYRHRFLESRRLSVGLTVLRAQLDVEAAGSRIGTIVDVPVMAEASWHLLASRSLHVGIAAGYSMWGDFEPDGVGNDVAIRKNAVPGLTLGYDVPFAERWALLTNLRYLSQEIETDEPGVNETIDVNPVVVNVGVAFRF